MDLDKDLLHALIERRQQVLARTGEQIKKEHKGLESKVATLISALDSRIILRDQAKSN